MTGYHETNYSLAYSSHISWQTPDLRVFAVNFYREGAKGAKETRRLQGHGVNASFEGR